jgi:hypothetical protein|tara:strand:- start:4351 stop:4572 length:222 start_codon:yes stop_codon:yes gene_type:complete
MTDEINEELGAEWNEAFTFKYKAGNSEVEFSQAWPGGACLTDLNGPIKMFKSFLNSAGYSSDVSFKINGKDIG